MLINENFRRNTAARVALQLQTHALELDMNLTPASLLLMTLLTAACGRQQTNSDGNGTGNADGVGGRSDPPSAPAVDLGQPAPAGDTSSSETLPAAGQSENK